MLPTYPHEALWVSAKCFQEKEKHLPIRFTSKHLHYVHNNSAVVLIICFFLLLQILTLFIIFWQERNRLLPVALKLVIKARLSAKLLSKLVVIPMETELILI